MSDAVIGADLAHLEALSAGYATAGEEIATKADTLRDNIDASVDAFVDALDRLKGEAITLTGAIDQEIDAVGTQAAGVQWTGLNRGAFDTDLGTFTGSVHAATAAINTDVTALKTEVDARFTPVLTEFGAALHDKGASVNTTATTTKTAVTTQRDTLDQAANVGWMSA